MLTTKNPKSYNSFFDFHLVLVNHKGEGIGYIVQYSRKTYNRFGGTNGWEVIQFVPKSGEYSIELENSKFHRDILPYEDLKVEQWFHMGAYGGEEERFFFSKGFKPIKVSLKNVSKNPSLWEEVIGRINLSWNGESQDVVEDDIIISDQYVLLKVGKTDLYYITKDGFKYRYVNKDILEQSFILTKNDLITMIKDNPDVDTDETMEAPDIEEIADARPRRTRRTRREE